MLALLLLTLVACLPTPNEGRAKLAPDTGTEGADTDDSGGDGDSGEGEGDDTGLVDKEAGEECDCPEGFQATSDDSECARELLYEPEVDFEIYEICQSELVHRGEGAIFPKGTVLETEFFQDRLSDTAIWACHPKTGEAGDEPVDQWIGLHLDFDAPADGHYLIGTSAQDGYYHRVDEEPLLVELEGGPAATHWQIAVVELDAGHHDISLMGRNEGGAAGFGADIAGPFTDLKTLDDASLIHAGYQDHILWSTRDRVATWFEYGESSGYTCPADTELVDVSGELWCSGEQRTECL